MHISIPLGMEAQYPPGIQLADLTTMTKPFMFIAAAEDFPLFNLSIEDNFRRYPAEAWRVVVRDTAHYSFTDICGLVPELDLGSCSPAPRQTDPSVTYEPLPIERARDLTKQFVATFFQRELLGQGRGPRSVARGADATLEHHR